MREIKFKGKTGQSKGYWVVGNLLVDKSRGQIIEDISYPIIYIIVEDGRRFEICPTTVCEFTGLKDKNGIDIYEGDILKMKNVGWNYTLVKFHYGTFAFYTNETNYLLPMVPQYWEEGEIVGNIYENSKLLERGVKTDT